MNINESDFSLKHWDNMYSNYIKKDKIKVDNWLEKFISIIEHCSTPIIDLGCGSGTDALYLIEKGKKVISCDQSKNAINSIKLNFPEIYDTKCFNMLDGLPFEDSSYELIIADLCLHYFKVKDTFKIINEIKRVLIQNGHLILRVNSINDINYGAGKGKEIEHHLYLTDNNLLKRFFDKDDILYFFADFDIEYIQEETITRFSKDKKAYNVCLKKL